MDPELYGTNKKFLTLINGLETPTQVNIFQITHIQGTFV